MLQLAVASDDITTQQNRLVLQAGAVMQSLQLVASLVEGNNKFAVPKARKQ